MSKKIFVALVLAFFAVSACLATDDSALAKKSTKVSVSPSPSAHLRSRFECPNPGAVADRFNGLPVCGDLVASFEEALELFPLIAIELGTLNGTLTALSFPDPATGIMTTQAVLITRLNLTFCNGGFHHTAEIFVPGVPSPISFVESMFYPTTKGSGEHQIFCESRLSDVKDYGYALNRMSYQTGRRVHSQVGHDALGYIVDYVNNYYPNDHQNIAMSIVGLSQKNGGIPTGIIVTNLINISR